MELENKKVWVVMDKKRTVIAKGNVRDRHLVRLGDKKCKKRYLTYSTKKRQRHLLVVNLAMAVVI